MHSTNSSEITTLFWVGNYATSQFLNLSSRRMFVSSALFFQLQAKYIPNVWVPRRSRRRLPPVSTHNTFMNIKAMCGALIEGPRFALPTHMRLVYIFIFNRVSFILNPKFNSFDDFSSMLRLRVLVCIQTLPPLFGRRVICFQAYRHTQDSTYIV